MKKKRFSAEPIAAVLKQADLGMPVEDVIRQVETSEQTFYSCGCAANRTVSRTWF